MFSVIKDFFKYWNNADEFENRHPQFKTCVDNGTVYQWSKKQRKYIKPTWFGWISISALGLLVVFLGICYILALLLP